MIKNAEAVPARIEASTQDVKGAVRAIGQMFDASQWKEKPEVVVPALMIAAFGAYAGGTISFSTDEEIQEFVGDMGFMFEHWATRLDGNPPEVKH